jgi:hypothetical protein
MTYKGDATNSASTRLAHASRKETPSMPALRDAYDALDHDAESVTRRRGNPGGSLSSRATAAASSSSNEVAAARRFSRHDTEASLARGYAACTDAP